MQRVNAQSPEGSRHRATARLLRMELWAHARLLPLLLMGRDLSSALRLADSGTLFRYEGLDPRYISNAVMRATRRPWLMRHRRCFRQGVLAYKYLKSAGFRPELHFSVATDGDNNDLISAHCWVELDGVAVVNENLDDMIPIHVHPPDAFRTS